MINPTKEDIGREVTYIDGAGDKEFGTISSFNDTYIHVKYGGDIHSKATSREDLHWRKIKKC